MRFENFIFVTSRGWKQLRAGALTECPPWPKLDSTTLVVTDFEEAPIGCYRFDGGKVAYAVPMIEKRARSEGLVEGVAHIVTHKVLQAPDGFQTFHTVVPLEFWQRLLQWAGQQPDHCLVLPLGALLAGNLRKGQARVLCLDRLLHCFAHTAGGLFHASATAAGDGLESLLTSVRVLAGLTRVELGKGIEGQVQWANMFAPDSGVDALLLAEWNSHSVLPAVALPMRIAGGAPGDPASALTALLERTGTWDAINPPLACWAWRSERFVGATAVVVALIAGGLLAAGLYLNGEASRQKFENNRSAASLQTLENRIALVNSKELPAPYVAVASFARKLGDGARFDPLPMLSVVREAAGSDINVQRLRLESTSEGERSFRVDGVAATGGVSAMGRFLARMRDAGWAARPLDPADTALGAFSYRLVALPAAGA